MRVEVTSYTQHPILAIGNAAGTSTDKYISMDYLPGPSTEACKKRVENCFKRGHLSVFEFANISFYISEISRACSHQLVRHRLASYCQKSQRYTKVDASGTDWYVIPVDFWYKEAAPGINVMSDELANLYLKTMSIAGAAYRKALEEGVKPEDARYLLPEATKTSISVSMNLRNFYHFLDLRTDEHAQQEIRNLAFSMEETVKGIDNEWAFLMNLRGVYGTKENRI